MDKHTPGKWTAECVGTGGAFDNPVDVYEVNNGYSRICEHVSELDAKLIAAAPDMLEALCAVVSLGDGQGQLNMMMVAGQARLAIARATGGES